MRDKIMFAVRMPRATDVRQLTRTQPDRGYSRWAGGFYKGGVDDDAALGLLVVQARGLGTVSRELPELAAYSALIGLVSAAALRMP